jgi:uncharacterized protein YbbC (DUF1343 family)
MQILGKVSNSRTINNHPKGGFFVALSDPNPYTNEIITPPLRGAPYQGAILSIDLPLNKGLAVGD